MWSALFGVYCCPPRNSAGVTNEIESSPEATSTKVLRRVTVRRPVSLHARRGHRRSAPVRAVDGRCPTTGRRAPVDKFFNDEYVVQTFPVSSAMSATAPTASSNCPRGDTRCSISGSQRVADQTDGLDERRAVPIELREEVTHACLDDAWIATEVVVPYVVEDLALRKNAPWVQQEEVRRRLNSVAVSRTTLLARHSWWVRLLI